MISHLLPLILLTGATGPASKATAFVDVSVLTMDRETVLPHQSVVVQGGKIALIGDAKKVPIPKGAQKIDGRGKFLMPGLVEMHAHLNSAPELALYLANGVTTIYNLNGSPGHLAWRKSIADGKLDGPRIVTCGPTVYDCETAEAGQKIARDYAKAGYDAIKIYNNVKKEAFFALTSTARELGLLTVGHIPRAVGLEGVVEAKMAIAHAEEFLYTYMRESGSPETVANAVKMTAKAGVAVTPTLIAFDHIIQQGKDLDKHLAQPKMQFLSPWSREAWSPGRNRYQNQFASEQSQANLTRMFRIQQNLVKELFKGGVKIVAGTDTMNPGIMPGFCIAEEVVQLHEAGLSRFEALRPAPAVPADVLQKAH
ncbi:MAG TPA: hypothetical protein PLX06_09710, partial [Fimbriimonadaceae bacterium]|nr:hypothetical protein [Fimbriimonadaceae bacterium]